jgi:DNA-binding transcriptional LysR family regulator
LEIEFIKEFVILAETGNYLKAADLLFISQPALSRHIMSLEKQLGVALFNRTTRSLELSEYGRRFLPYAREISRIKY